MNCSASFTPECFAMRSTTAWGVWPSTAGAAANRNKTTRLRAIFIDELAANDRGYGFSGQVPAVKRRVSALGPGLVDVEFPFSPRIQNSQVCVAPFKDTPGRHSHDLLRI